MAFKRFQIEGTLSSAVNSVRIKINQIASRSSVNGIGRRKPCTAGYTSSISETKKIDSTFNHGALELVSTDSPEQITAVEDRVPKEFYSTKDTRSHLTQM